MPLQTSRKTRWDSRRRGFQKLTSPNRDQVPFLTTDQMRDVDWLMTEVYHIELIQMMENAGRNLAQLARDRFFNRILTGNRVMVLAGAGANGGGALVAARWLHNGGAVVTVCLAAATDRYTGVQAHQLDILERLEVPMIDAASIVSANGQDLIIDGIIGYGLHGAPTGAAANLIRWANSHGVPILALDAPSGLDTTTGVAAVPSICADVTMTLALPKEGLRTQDAKGLVGELYVANIGVPPELYSHLALNVTAASIFETGDIIRLW